MDIAVLGIDLGKTVCSVAGVDGTDAVVMRLCAAGLGLWQTNPRTAP